jgi:hypothetical protein
VIHSSRPSARHRRAHEPRQLALCPRSLMKSRGGAFANAPRGRARPDPPSRSVRIGERSSSPRTAKSKFSTRTGARRVQGWASPRCDGLVFRDGSRLPTTQYTAGDHHRRGSRPARATSSLNRRPAGRSRLGRSRRSVAQRGRTAVRPTWTPGGPGEWAARDPRVRNRPDDRAGEPWRDAEGTLRAVGDDRTSPRCPVAEDGLHELVRPVVARRARDGPGPVGGSGC